MIGICFRSYVAAKLTWVDEVAFGFDGIVFNVISYYAVIQFRITDTVITGFNIAGKIFADKTVEKRAQNVLLKVPSIDRTSDIVSNLPDLAMKLRAAEDWSFFIL